MVFSPVDSLNKAILKLEGVNVPAAKYSFVWSGQNAMEDVIPTTEWLSGGACGGTLGSREGDLTFQAVLGLLRRGRVKSRPFVVPFSVYVKHFDRVFEPAVEPTGPRFGVRTRPTERILTRAAYFVALVLNDRQ